MITLTYFGAEKVVPGYNVMGVAKAALEATVRYLETAGRAKDSRERHFRRPIKTLAARGMGDFTR